MSDQSLKRLNGKIAIVTGGAEGIGNAIVSLFARHGAKVCFADINQEKGEAAARRVKELGDDAHFIKADISEAGSVAAFIEEAVLQYGAPDILINNAGIIHENADLLATDLETWERSFGVNLEGMWECSRHVLPYMIERGTGSIVNLGSVHSFKIVRGHFPYAVTKHAVIGLTKTLAVEFGQHNIRVNALCPGMVETEAAFKWYNSMPDPEKIRREIGKMHPLGRSASPDEMAYPALFLASDESSFMTGQSLIVDGGRSAVYCD